MKAYNLIRFLGVGSGSVLKSGSMLKSQPGSETLL